MMYIDYERVNELATSLRSSGEWDFDLIKKLCEIAGLEEEWNNSDSANFGDVAYKIAEILDMDID